MDQNQKTETTEFPVAVAVQPEKSTVVDSVKKIAVYLIIAAVCLIVLNFIIKSLVADETNAKFQKIDEKVTNIEQSMSKNLDSIKQANQFFADRMYTVESRQLQFQNRIDMNTRAIGRLSSDQMKLKKIYNEKIHVVGGYSVSQLDSFFSNRYNSKK